MLSSNLQYNNDHALQETNGTFQSIMQYIQECNSKSQFSKNAAGFLSLIHQISIFMKNKLTIFKDFRSTGLILFNDRILINHSIFSNVINWDEKILCEIISSPEFFCTSLTRSQFITLVNSKYIDGCIFDWHILRYPECDLSYKIIKNIIPAGGESFFLVSNNVQSMINDKKMKFQLNAFNIADKPPSKNILHDDQNLSSENIFLRYVDDVSSGKCWLLYKNVNEK